MSQQQGSDTLEAGQGLAGQEQSAVRAAGDTVPVACRLSVVVGHHTVWAVLIGHHNYVLAALFGQCTVVLVVVIGQCIVVQGAVIGYRTEVQDKSFYVV